MRTSDRRFVPEHLHQLHVSYRRPGPGRALAVAAIAVISLLCSGAAGPVQCQEKQIGPSTGEVVGTIAGVGAVVVGTVVLIEVQHSHHTVKGCVFAGPQGLEVQTQNDLRTYVLDGDTASVKTGDLVRFHGSKVKKVKDSTGDQTFTVEKISRDYGPCHAAPNTSAPAGR
jgi:hypothetical protein